MKQLTSTSLASDYLLHSAVLFHLHPQSDAVW